MPSCRRPATSRSSRTSSSHGDPYLDGDAVFAVKNSLIAKYKKLGDAEAKKVGLPAGSFKLDFDFKLSPDKAGAKKARKKIAASDAVA